MSFEHEPIEQEKENPTVEETSDEVKIPGKKDFTDEEMAEILARSTAKANCKRCHGRGRMGRNVTTGKHIVCVCVDKAARKVAAEITL